MPTPEPAENFIEVTTPALRKRHWMDVFWNLSTLCGLTSPHDQPTVDRLHRGAFTIADLPPCVSCDRSRQRRIDGRGH